MGQGGGYRNVFLFLPIRRQGATRVRRQQPLGMCGPVGLEYRQLALRRWIGAPDFPSERVGTGLTSLKRKRRVGFENACRSMPFACASGLLQATSPASFAFSTAIDPAL